MQSTNNELCSLSSTLSLQAGEAAVQQLDEAMAANLEAAAREREAADLKRRQESKLNDYKYTTDVWGTDPTDQELDGKKVRGQLVMVVVGGCCIGV